MALPAERWVLKAPSHLFALDALLAVYPDALIIQTHRHPLQVVASVASMDTVLRRVFSYRVNLKETGTEALQQWAYGVERAMQVRHSDHAAPGRFFDAYYTDLVREPIAMVQWIHALRLSFYTPIRNPDATLFGRTSQQSVWRAPLLTGAVWAQLRGGRHGFPGLPCAVPACA